MERYENGILQNGFVDPANVQAMVDQAMGAALTQWVLNQAVTEGQTVTIPDTDKDFTLNLLTGGASLNTVNVVLPGNSAGRVGQRGFVNCDGPVANVNFTSAIQVNNSDVMFSPGDNYVYYRNQPNIWSRVTS